MEIIEKEKYYLDDTYAKSNFLIGSKFRSTLYENRLTAIALAYIPEGRIDKEGGIEVTIPGVEIKKIFGIKENGAFFKRLDDTAEKLTGKTIGWSNPETNSFEYTAVITDARFTDGEFTCQFNKSIQKYIKDIKTNYTLLSLSAMMKFSSTFSFRLYEILKSQCYTPKGVPKTNKFKIKKNITELKLELGVIDADNDKVKKALKSKEHPDFDREIKEINDKIKKREDKILILEKWSEFNRACLRKAVNEINENSESTLMHVEYEPVKYGRGGKVHDVIFYVEVLSLNDSVEEIEEIEDDFSEEEFLDDIIELIDEKIKIKDAKSIAAASNWNLEVIKEKYEMSKGQDIENLVAWLIAAIKNDYEKPISSKKTQKNKFNNFTERNYNYDELLKEIT